MLKLYPGPPTELRRLFPCSHILHIANDPWDVTGRVHRLTDTAVAGGGFCAVYKGSALIPGYNTDMVSKFPFACRN